MSSLIDETNLARFVFGNPAARDFLPDWPKVGPLRQGVRFLVSQGRRQVECRV